MQEFPSSFAILRRGSRPYWQFFEATYHQNDNAYEIKSPPWENEILSVNDSGILPFQENAVRFVRIRLHHGSIRQVVFWFVPVILDTGLNNAVPLLDFSFKAWLPRPSRRIHVAYSNEIPQTMDMLQSRYSSLTSSISYIPDESEMPEVPVRPPTPPRSRSSTPQQAESDDETQSVMTVYPQEPWLGSPRRLDFPPLPATPINEDRLPLQIPHHVGNLLIDDARRSSDTCPISAIAFSEIPRLAVTSCFHVFDCEALNQWRHEHNSCPVCRTPIINVVTK
jgi:hypothetical protein